MNTFYSLIKVSPNPAAGDTITIGILVAGKSRIYIKISDNKLSFLKKILSDNIAIIDYVIKEIKLKVYEANNTIETNKNVLFESKHMFSIEYFDYLNRYSNNLLQFGKPISLYDNVSDDNVNKLFSLLVDSEMESEITSYIFQENTFIEKIQNKLISRVQNRVHTNYLFDDKLFPGLFFRVQMDCIGLNGVFTGAKSLIFNKGIHTLGTHVSEYITLIAEIEKKYNKETGNNFYLIADEPAKNTHEYNFWQKIRELKKIKLITSDETEEIAEKIEKSDSKKFLVEV